MSLYVIGDLHLSFSTEKPMDIFGNRWDNYMVKIENEWKKIVNDNDTVVIAGDVSWAMTNDELNDTNGRGTVECIFAKNRHGSTGIVKLGWYGQYTKFIGIAQDRDEQ